MKVLVYLSIVVCFVAHFDCLNNDLDTKAFGIWPLALRIQDGKKKSEGSEDKKPKEKKKSQDLEDKPKGKNKSQDLEDKPKGKEKSKDSEKKPKKNKKSEDLEDKPKGKERSEDLQDKPKEKESSEDSEKKPKMKKKSAPSENKPKVKKKSASWGNEMPPSPYIPPVPRSYELMPGSPGWRGHRPYEKPSWKSNEYKRKNRHHTKWQEPTRPPHQPGWKGSIEIAPVDKYKPAPPVRDKGWR